MKGTFIENLHELGVPAFRQGPSCDAPSKLNRDTKHDGLENVPPASNVAILGI